ncbi:MAG: GDP-mannose 4,6-dehydratase, partial [Candidatus Aenigmarchaeota archaeon]|nr:GDP-mannose 4,6-dehydratase [Candidatus Aenigmarchaeota archaeon]
LNDKNPIIYGDGEQTRDFTYIKNVVNANILAARTERPLNGEVINVACGKRIDLNQLVEKLNSIIGKNIEPVYEDERAGDIKHSLADISKAKRLINYSPIYDIDEGLKETVEWYENE